MQTSADNSESGQGHKAKDPREFLRHEVHHYAHILSEQGPMNITFVHNNTLLGLQHLHFEQAVVEAEHVLGSHGYEPIENFRNYYAQGRISPKQLDRALADRADALRLDESIATVDGSPITRRQVMRTHLVHGVDVLSAAELRQVTKSGEMRQWQSDVPESVRAQLAKSATTALRTQIARIGKELTLSAWLGGVLALDLDAALLECVELGHDQGDDADSALVAMGVPSQARSAYLDLVGQKLSGLDSSRNRASWLVNESRMVAELAQRHWGVGGTLPALTAFFERHPELYSALTLWGAALKRCGVDDPLGTTEPTTLEEVDPELDAIERIGLLVRIARDDAGQIPTVLTKDDFRQLDFILSEIEGDPASSMAIQHLCKDVRAMMDHKYIRALGLEVLQALAEKSQRTDLTELLGQLRQLDPSKRRQSHIAKILEDDIASFSHGNTHLAWLESLTGKDLIDPVNQYMIRVCASFLDEGLSAWRMPERHLGFFAAWRKQAAVDQAFRLEGNSSWKGELAALPERADEAVIYLMDKLGIEQSAWGEYLGRSLAQLKGWAGMVYWYESHPTHYKQSVQSMDTIQYLAVRLFVTWLTVRQVTTSNWGVDARLDSLRRHFEVRSGEYFVRKKLFGHGLADAWAEGARQALVSRSGAKLSEMADAAWLQHELEQEMVSCGGSAWRLFRLAQYLGWSAADVTALTTSERDALLSALDDLTVAKQSPIWLVAYERHYRDEVLNAIAQNHGRGRWANGRKRRPRSQVVFCIDEREENLHRHYAELDPEHETLGAAGFFGVAQAFSALDDHLSTPLCPAVATPVHRIMEIPRNEALHDEYPVHKRRHKWMEVFHDAYWETKRNLAGSFFLIQLAGLFMSIPLLARVLAPRAYAGAAGTVHDFLVPPVRTRVTHVRIEEKQAQSLGLHSDGLPIGFAINEAADRVEAQLRNWGLTYQFSRIVVICAHRSYSVNNPHENAHDCGACGGKPGGHNSRLFAALANDPQVRDVLRSRGIDIPDDTWFVGAEHNTASSKILSFDTQDIPSSLRADWQLVSADLEEARRRGARERCRRFGSAPKDQSLDVSTHHVEARSQDLSQVRPEWGHCTNAFAVVGRRCVTQGLFFDRRGFIISYDPTQDADGKILERILLAVGPVGAGINLEYYFSTVDPDSYGCGTKVPHNVTGMIGVMAGAHGDLQTGLPRQMTEVHEAMRLQLIVDAPMAILGEIYGRQAGIRQLLDNQWVHLIAHDPETGELNLFVPGKGFEKWDEPLSPLPEVNESFEWFKGKYECFLPPARIAEPTTRWNSSNKVH